MLTPNELERGWAEFVCPDHGFVAATFARAVVVCKCRRKARPERLGQPLLQRDIKQLPAAYAKAA